MFFLEQEILRLKLAEKSSNVEESPFGMDVYFNKHDHALKFAEACQNIVPISHRTDSKKLTGQDSQNNVFKFRHTICLEIVPICKHDICIISKPLKSSLLGGGGKNGLILVEKIARNIHIRDLETGKLCELQPSKFFAHPFRSMATSRELTEFMVLDVDDSVPENVLEVARLKDFGENDTRFFVPTWSYFTGARKLESGDIVLGYDLTNFQHDDISDYDVLPQAVLLKKKQSD